MRGIQTQENNPGRCTLRKSQHPVNRAFFQRNPFANPSPKGSLVDHFQAKSAMKFGNIISKKELIRFFVTLQGKHASQATRFYQAAPTRFAIIQVDLDGAGIALVQIIRREQR
jgi:hypothetical protein